MKKSVKLFIALVLSLLLTTNAWSQTSTAGDNVSLEVMNICLMETNSATVSLTLCCITPGEALTPATNSDLFVRISSIVPANTSRDLTARISTGAVPYGTILKLVSASCTTTNSGGNLGTALSTPITLSAIDQNLITGIGTCYTGTGNNDGYQMTYTWEPDYNSTNYGLIESLSTTNILVVFTISNIY